MVWEGFCFWGFSRTCFKYFAWPVKLQCYRSFRTVSIFCQGPPGNLPCHSWWSSDLTLGTPHPNMCTLHLSILEVAMCFRGGSTQHLSFLPSLSLLLNTSTGVKLFFSPPPTLLRLLLRLLPPKKKKKASLQTVSYPPPQMPYLGYKCEEMTAL